MMCGDAQFERLRQGLRRISRPRAGSKALAQEARALGGVRLGRAASEIALKGRLRLAEVVQEADEPPEGRTAERRREGFRRTRHGERMLGECFPVRGVVAVRVGVDDGSFLGQLATVPTKGCTR